MMWIGNQVLGRDEAAYAVLKPLDEQNDLAPLVDFVSYHYFDPRPYPNLMNYIRTQGVEPRQPLDMAYRCRAAGNSVTATSGV